MKTVIVSAICAALQLTTGLSPGAVTHGYQEFTASGNFIAPKGVKAVQVEMWGGGGGGGTGAGDLGGFGEPGGAGGSGGYSRGWIAVKQGGTYAVTVGSPGTGGSASGAATSGGDTKIADASANVLVSAGGGGAGGAGVPGIPGTAGAGGAGSSLPGVLSRDGHIGSGYNTVITPAIQGTVELSTTERVSTGGVGGPGFDGSGVSEGSDGGRGHVIVSW